jgi:glycine cleavage system H protein
MRSVPQITSPFEELIPEDVQACVWMQARLVAYKLCDRNFDCDRCPLDSALRGRQATLDAADASPSAPQPAWDFPEDRAYASNHHWVKTLEDGRVSVGLDAFASHLLGTVDRVLCSPVNARIECGAIATDVELSRYFVSLRAPCSGRIIKINDALEKRPHLLVNAAYGEGWLYEMAVAQAAGQGLDLLTGSAMSERARLDLQHFGRRIGMQLLMASSSVGAAMAEGCEPIHDVRQMLGLSAYLKIVQELLA